MSKMPQLGANPLQEAFDNYQAMEQQLAMAEDELREYRTMNNDLLRENEYLRDRLGKVELDRDRLQAIAVNLSTRATILQEAANNLIGEALRAGAQPPKREESKENAEDEKKENPVSKADAKPMVVAPETRPRPLFTERAVADAIIRTPERLPQNQMFP